MSSQPHGSATPRPRSIAPEDCPVLVVDDDESLVLWEVPLTVSSVDRVV